MTKTNHPAAIDDTIPPTGEPDAPVAAWTLDELDQFGELASLRSVWTGADDFGR